MKHQIVEFDNRDSGITELVLENGDRVDITYEEAVDLIVSSFMENSLEGHPKEVQKMLDLLHSKLQFTILEYLP